MTDAPKKLDRDVLEELICGAHDAMIVLDQIIDNIDECRLKEPDEWRVKVNLASLIESGTVILFLTKLHNAAVVAGEAEAIVIQQVTERAGIRILRSPPGAGAYKPGDTQAVAAVASLIRNRGERGARVVLTVLARARLAPVSMNDIRAADHLIHDDDFMGWFQFDELTKTIADMGVTADQEARVFAATHCVPRWRGLASVWFKNVKKVKARIQAVEAIEAADDLTAPEAEKAPADSGGAQPEGNQPKATEIQSLKGDALANGNQPPRRPSVVSIMGEPPPGRSALDQRRAEEAAKTGGRR